MDRRRVQGPETSVVPLPTREALGNRATLAPPVQSGKRVDGRGPEDIRPICESIASRAKKSGRTMISSDRPTNQPTVSSAHGTH